MREFGVAVMLLTRVPAGWLAGTATVETARVVWAFPLVGALVGAGGASVLAGGRAAGMGTALAAVWAVAAMALLSGALHEDGLADVADGFGGGGTRDRKLDIMRDSRIGSYGALALVLAVGVRVFAMAGVSVMALVAVGAVSRGAMAVPLLLLRPARDVGLGSLVVGAGVRRWVCLGLGIGVAFVVVPPGQAGVGVLAAVGAAWVMTGLARSHIGGFTGDVLGGCVVAAECAGLTAMACVS
jgi:adenosylcobinamide-GDP ribazoletransferase